jgi:hypothetical protein
MSAFNTNLYTTSLTSVYSDNLSPSLSHKSNFNSIVGLNKSLNTYVSVHTNPLDLLTGSNVNFFFNVTTNSQNFKTNTTSYFNLLSSLNVSSVEDSSSTKIKFYF